MSLYWLQQTIIVLPLVMWVYIGLGIPYALLMLPRAEWVQKATITALAFAFGPALLTAWMLILGMIGGRQETALLRFDFVFGGTVIIAVIGYALLWQKFKRTERGKTDYSPLAFDEKLLIALMVIAWIIRWIVTSYWSFTAYDTLWVYGYEGRLYQLLGYIPETIGYYPQFIPLQYTFLQLLSNGFDDHAARAIIPFIHMGSILAVYVMGSRLFSRRAGIIGASIWTLYPHVAQWAHVGDLEIPLTFLLTLTMVFFLNAWFEKDQALRRRYALIAGVCFGIAMWTKPTGGAFIWGVIVLVIAEFIRVRFDWRAWLPRFEIAVITGIACVPLGAIWYIRNVALGLPALVFPHPNWLTLATRSGDLLSFPILALLLAIAYLASKQKLQHGWITLVGVFLILAGAMPSSPLINELRRNPPDSYIQLHEALALIAGLVLIVWSLRDVILAKTHDTFHKIMWAYLLILPYFMTWFWSYSYHARLSFPIVPVLLLPIAFIIGQWLMSVKVEDWQITTKAVWASLLVLLSIPAITIPIVGIAPTYNYLWTNVYPNDFSRTRLHNPGVALVAEQLWGNQAFYGRPPTVIAPGEQRLRFFLPDATIITDIVPTTLQEIDGATHFVYGTQARWRYENDEGIVPAQNQIVSSLGRTNLFNQILDFESGTFQFELYELNLDQRFALPEGGPADNPLSEDVIFGDAIHLWGISLNNTQFAGNRVILSFLWEALDTPQGDYRIQLDLLNTDDNQVYHTWDLQFASAEHAYYHSALWETGEYILDPHDISLYVADLPRGADIYRIVVKIINNATGEILPVTINGEEAESYTIQNPFSIGR